MTRARRKRLRSRRGAALFGWLMAIVVVLLSMGALVIDASLISARHQQLTAACQSASRAGASELMDRSVLYSDISPDDGRIQLMRMRQDWRARQQAKRFAGYNSVGGESLTLNDSESNQTGGETIVGWVDNPTALKAPMQVWTGDGPFNSIEVRKSLSQATGNPLSLRLAKLMGKNDVDIQAVARATVDQRVFGFQPVNGMAIPLLPLLVRPVDSGAGWLEQAWQPTNVNNDRFAFNESANVFEIGSDGIPEIVLVFRIGTDDDDSSEEINAALLSLPNSGEPLRDRIGRQIRTGLTPEDLVLLGGRFALPTDGPLVLAKSPPISEALAQTLATELRALAMDGKKRIWPLGDESSELDDDLQTIRGFAAGRVVSVKQAEDRLIVHVQACLMTTGTALAETGRPLNPWVGKVVRTL